MRRVQASLATQSRIVMVLHTSPTALDSTAVTTAASEEGRERRLGAQRTGPRWVCCQMDVPLRERCSPCVEVPARFEVAHAQCSGLITDRSTQEYMNKMSMSKIKKKEKLN